jgi:hypothetical protein
MVRDYEEVGELTLANIPRIDPEILLIYGHGSAFLAPTSTCACICATSPRLVA